MAEVKKWSVMYTKHIKQKRKVYQDGILELRSSRNKVILYDECEQVLESRFVKKDDAFTSGETLSFEAYLVDIGDPQGDDHKPIPKFSSCPKGIPESFHSPKFERKPYLGQKKARSINISPSQKIIREFKNSQVIKYGSSPVCPETTKSSKEEWEVLYTAQITKKAKKYHDGFLQLHSCGSLRKQVVLYDETRRLLESRFLKKDEIIKSGESVAFDGHLVEIGECKDHKPPMDFQVQGRTCKMVSKTEAVGGQIHFHDQFPVGEYKKEVPSKHINANFKSSVHENYTYAPGASKKPVRAAHEILSILKKTKSETDVAKQDEGSTIVDLDEEKTRKTDNSEISKYETVKEVLSIEISESDKAGFESASSFFVGSGDTIISQHINDIDYTVNSRAFEDAPGFEFKSLATPELELNSKSASVLQDPSIADLESRNRTELLSCKENPTGGAPAAVSGSDVHQVYAEVESKDVSQPSADCKENDTKWLNGGHVIGMATLSDGTPHEASDYQTISEQDISANKTDDFPSFDLGF